MSVSQPAVMTATTQAANLKYQTISDYTTQFSPWLASFVKSDEIFWNTELWANLAVTATATASSTRSTLTTPDRAADGSVTGTPLHENGEWVSDDQHAGAWIQLTWPSERTLVNVVLHDRTLSSENVTGGTLSFSDGSSVAVSALPSSGAGMAVSFPSRSATWIRFTGDIRLGNGRWSLGVRGLRFADQQAALVAAGGNVPPTITTVAFANPSLITDGQTSSLSVTADDINNDALSYSWTPAQGQVNGTGATVTFVPPVVTAQTTVRVNLSVADGRGGTASGFVDVGVTPSGLPNEFARTATATASSENEGRGQTAAKAIDGIARRLPHPSDPLVGRTRSAGRRVDPADVAFDTVDQQHHAARQHRGQCSRRRSDLQRRQFTRGRHVAERRQRPNIQL